MEFERHFDASAVTSIVIHRPKDRLAGPGRMVLWYPSWTLVCDIFMQLMKPHSTARYRMRDGRAAAYAPSAIGGWVSIYKRADDGMVMLSNEEPDMYECSSLNEADDPASNFRNLLDAEK